ECGQCFRSREISADGKDSHDGRGERANAHFARFLGPLPAPISPPRRIECAGTPSLPGERVHRNAAAVFMDDARALVVRAGGMQVWGQPCDCAAGPGRNGVMSVHMPEWSEQAISQESLP